MSFDAQQLEEHCQTILQSRRIKNKIVILCEGSFAPIKGRRSPQSYGRMEEFPDANFYKACVPQKHNQYLPEFFNCGDRSTVIETHFKLLELHDQNPKNSYLTPKNLFTLVDLDIQIRPIYDYSFSDTESIFENLYCQFKVNEKNVTSHRIWTTGLIHKEAYFLIPELQIELFDKLVILGCDSKPEYKNNPLSLETIYWDMINSLSQDKAITTNFKTVKNRLKNLSFFEANGEEISPEQLQTIFQEKFKNAKDEEQKQKVILSLLTIKNAKTDYWEKIKKPKNWPYKSERFREQILLKIADFYSKKSQNPQYHIPYFLETVQAIAAQSQNEYLIALTQNSD